jgi:hypothetical protein
LGQEQAQAQALFPLVLMPKQILQPEQAQAQAQALEPWALIQGPWTVHRWPVSNNREVHYVPFA